MNLNQFFADTNVNGELAVGKPAKQSTTLEEDHHAGLAVDSNYDGDGGASQQFSQTEMKAHQWWMVDLGAIWNICGVSMFAYPGGFCGLLNL